MNEQEFGTELFEASAKCLEIAGTGKIMGFENKRGIHTLIKMLNQ